MPLRTIHRHSTRLVTVTSSVVPIFAIARVFRIARVVPNSMVMPSARVLGVTRIITADAEFHQRNLNVAANHQTRTTGHEAKMQNHLQSDRVITTSLLLAAIVLAGGCHGQRCNIFRGCHGCWQPCPYGCTDCGNSAYGGCCDEDCDECGGSGDIEPLMFALPPMPATGGADANMPPDVSTKASPDSQRAKPNDIAPQTPRLAKRPRTDRPNTKNPKAIKLKPPKPLSDQTPAKTTSLEPSPAAPKDRDKTSDRTKAKPTSNTSDKKGAAAPRSKGALQWRARQKAVDIVRPAASFGEFLPGAGGGSKDSVSSLEKVRAARYEERPRLLTVKEGRGSTSFVKKTGPAKKASHAKIIGPAKKVGGKSTRATGSDGAKQTGRQSTHPVHCMGTIQAGIDRKPDPLKRAAPSTSAVGPEKIRLTLRFRTQSAVTLKSAGQPPHASRPHSSTSANPPSRLQSVRR